MRTPKPEWVSALRALCGSEADLRFNDHLSRWEFVLPEADGKLRSQFWCVFTEPADPVTGLKPFRDLNDVSFREALHNLESTFLGNPHDGAGSARAEIKRRMDFNDELKRKRRLEKGHLFADMWYDRLNQLHRKVTIDVPVVVGGEKSG